MRDANQDSDDEAVDPQPRRSLRVSVGGLELAGSTANVTSKLGDRSRASFSIDSVALSHPVDLSATVYLTAEIAQPDDAPPLEHHLFTGHVTRARADTFDGLALEAEAGIELAESVVGFVRTQKVHPSEQFYLLGRLAGLPSERIEAPSLESLPSETFVVEVPLKGVAIDRITEVMGIQLLPLDHPASERLPWGPFTPFAREIESRWGKPTARARAQIDGRLMYDAEQSALHMFEQALDGTLATAIYGLSVDPWNRALSFDRRRSRMRPATMPVVYSLGLATGRQWIHTLAGPAQEIDCSLGDQFERWADLLQKPPSDHLDRGLRALREAADESRDIFDRCHALCTVLEYYSSTVSLPPAVSRSSRRQAMKALDQTNATESERQALRRVISQVNSAPLLAKVSSQADHDRVPLNPREWDLLSSLRRARNAKVHGRVSAEVPDQDEIRWGVSIASRLLLHRWIAETS